MMKIRLTTLRKIIREEMYRNNFWYGMSSMNIGGAGLNKPTVHSDLGGVPPGLGDQDEEIEENEKKENEEVNYEKQRTSSRDDRQR